MNSRKIFGYGLIAVKVLLAVLLALTAFSCDDANGNGTTATKGQVTLPQGLQGKTYAQSDGGTITFASDTVTVTGSDGTTHTYKIKSQERTGNKTKLKFGDSASKDYIVVSDNGTIEEVVFDEVSGEGEWTYQNGGNPNPGGPEFDDTQVKLYFYDNKGNMSEYPHMVLVPFGSNVPQNVRNYYVSKKEGYDFTGWYTERDGDTLYDFDTVLTKENVQPEMQNIDEAIVQTGWYINVYAGWKVHVITFEEMMFISDNLKKDSNGKSVSQEAYVYEEDMLKLPESGLLDQTNIDCISIITFLQQRINSYSNMIVSFNCRNYSYGVEEGESINDFLYENPVLKDDERLPMKIYEEVKEFRYEKYKIDDLPSFKDKQKNIQGSLEDSVGLYKIKLESKADNLPVVYDVLEPNDNHAYQQSAFLKNCLPHDRIDWDDYSNGPEYRAAWIEVNEARRAFELVITDFEYDYENNRFAWFVLEAPGFMKPGKYLYRPD